MSWARVIGMALVSASLLIGGCALAPPATGSMPSATTSWRGRLAVSVESETAQARSFAAGFELIGSPQKGELTLYTPLGTTLASLAWSQHAAVLHQGSDQRHFASLDALIMDALGTELPIQALFAWLGGDPLVLDGWSADLSHYASGSILARRSQPAPGAELRLVLEK